MAYKHSFGLLSRKAILVCLCQLGDLVYSRPPILKTRLFMREQWVDDWFDPTAAESLEDRGHTVEI